ncbi:MAG: DNA polymerase III subunit gamma/tau [Holosporaceae bacterium]|nr:DNA polymerase III subunit gamma/tau [Holosporaceae bacterium]
MSIYVPLATKYRPQSFRDVVGQDLTVKTITRGLQKNRLGAAMLFSGTRGIGKTTIARILAKTFRCEKACTDDPEPCCKCESCLGFARDNQIDVIEIDAASNTSVEDVREIIDSSRYRPTKGQFKVFIIDEVHMLSKSAFNALLKTLEEPPPHVKFLFATTETYKIPETIMSRVLKFDLKKVNAHLIAQYLSSICNRENVVADAETLAQIAKAADGSIRDGLSILDQVINISENNKLSSKDIKGMLNMSDDNEVIDLLELIFVPDLRSAVEKYREILRSNALANTILNRLIDIVYITTCIKTNVPPQELLVEEELLPRLRRLSENVSLAALSRIWQMLLKGMEEQKFCERADAVLEMLLIRIAYASELPDLRKMMENVQQSPVEPSIKVVKSKAFPKDGQVDTESSLLGDALKMFSGSKLE